MGGAGDSEAEREGEPLMDAETCAALEWIKRNLHDIANSLANNHDIRDGSVGALHGLAARLQALLDGEKGGGAALSTGDSSGTAKRVTEPGAPPDSPAKIAADLLEISAMFGPQVGTRLATIAARVEALGLEPRERLVVTCVTEALRTLLADISNGTHHQCRSCELILKVQIQALTPIAERR